MSRPFPCSTTQHRDSYFILYNVAIKYIIYNIRKYYVYRHIHIRLENILTLRCIILQVEACDVIMYKWSRNSQTRFEWLPRGAVSTGTIYIIPLWISCDKRTILLLFLGLAPFENYHLGSIKLKQKNNTRLAYTSFNCTFFL